VASIWHPDPVNMRRIIQHWGHPIVSGFAALTAGAVGLSGMSRTFQIEMASMSALFALLAAISGQKKPLT
jgi:hypothetical protein